MNQDTAASTSPTKAKQNAPTTQTGQRILNTMKDMRRDLFLMGWSIAQLEAGMIAENNGFTITNQAETMALIHSEISEALEALRHGNPPDDKIPEFSGVEAELADAVIRIMHLAHVKAYRLPQAILAKMKFNTNRPHKHGKEF